MDTNKPHPSHTHLSPWLLAVWVPAEDLVVLGGREEEVRVLGAPGDGEHASLMVLKDPHWSSSKTKIPHLIHTWAYKYMYM